MIQIATKLDFELGIDRTLVSMLCDESQLLAETADEMLGSFGDVLVGGEGGRFGSDDARECIHMARSRMEGIEDYLALAAHDENLDAHLWDWLARMGELRDGLREYF